MDRIAVIVPVYNVEPYLRNCVDSLLGQSMRDFLLFIVDDGSTDGSGGICDEYAVRDARVRVIHQQNAGQSAARNVVLDAITAEGSADYVTFVDADDWVLPTYLEELVCGLSDGAEISSVPFFRVGEDDVPDARCRPVVWQTMTPREFWAVPDRNRSAACGKLYSLRLLDGIRFPVGRICEDELTNYRIFFRADKVSTTATPLYAYRHRAGSTMCSPWSPRRMARIDAWRDQIRFFAGLGYSELAEDSRRCLVVDLVDAVRNLRQLGDAVTAEACRRSLAEELSAGRLSVADNYLAYKTAHPLKTRLLKPLAMLCGGFSGAKRREGC